MHIYFSGIGGAGIGPLALVARQAGYEVSGSDKQLSSYTEYLQNNGIHNIQIGQSTDGIAAVHQSHPIDWFVYSSALPMEDPDHPELVYCTENGIKMSKRDEFLNQILRDKQLKLIAIAGTHGKTTTTAMAVWLMKELGIPISYLLPGKTSFASLGAFDPASEYFIYEADEFDRNFLSFDPTISLITGIDWDHPDIYPTRDDYNLAFNTFIGQSDRSYIWQSDAQIIDATESATLHVLGSAEGAGCTLPGEVNRQNAMLVAHALLEISGRDDIAELIAILNKFPGVSRRFEHILPGLLTDYAHTPPKIRGALQLGHEVAGERLVVVYEGLHNTRQHFIKDELLHLFDSVSALYIVPSYLAREDASLEMLTPNKLKLLLSDDAQAVTVPSQLDASLESAIRQHLSDGDIVLCLTAGGSDSLDGWLRRTFTS